jgi:uncharacterized membrane protein YfbV (UPF0208 family)
MNDQMMEQIKTASTRQLTITESLEIEQQTLKERLLEVERALKALKENPSLQEVLDLVGKVTRRL